MQLDNNLIPTLTHLDDLTKTNCIFFGDERYIDADTTRFYSIDKLYSVFQMTFRHRRNEELLIGVIRNYIRKENFSNLNQDLDNEEITEEQFETELKTCPNKYTIEISPLQNYSDMSNIVELVAKIGHNLKDFTVSDVSEMFSVQEDDLLKSYKLVQ